MNSILSHFVNLEPHGMANRSFLLALLPAIQLVNTPKNQKVKKKNFLSFVLFINSIINLI
jgi:hypothetical protein